MALTLSGSNGVAGVDGSAGTPALQGSDTNTGIAFGADTILGSTGGTERFRVDSSGRFGIGTASPSGKLTVVGGTTSSSTVVVTDNTNYTFELGRSRDNTGSFGYIGGTSGSGLTLGSNDTERVRIDTSGRVLVGTSTARDKYFASTIAPAFQVEGSTTATSAISAIRNSADDNQSYLILAKSRSSSYGVVSSGDSIGEISFQAADGTNFLQAARITAVVDGTPGTNDMPCKLSFSTTADGASSPTEAMSINNAGSILINTGIGAPGGASVTGRAAITFNPSTHGGLVIASGSGAGTLQQFTNTAFGVVGSITTNGTATAFNTSSDYRLKENVVDLSNALDRLRQIPVRRFNFIADPDNTVDGFLAHEVQDVVPEAITGEKDAVDDDGNAVYQGIDQSKLVPLLTAALQEAVAKIESLEARLTAAGI